MSDYMYLPHEIWHNIIHELDGFTAQPRLARTCKFLHNEVNPILYRHISLDNRNLRPFLRTACQNQDLAALVSEVTLEWDIEDDEAEYTDDVPELPLEMENIFLETAELHDWANSDLDMLKTNSLDAEGKLVLQLLPNLKSIHLAFPRGSPWDQEEGGWTNNCGIERYTMLQSYINDPRNSQEQLAKIQRFQVDDPYLCPGEICESGPGALFWNLKDINGIFRIYNLRHLSLEKCSSGYLPPLEEFAGKLALESISIKNANLSASNLGVILSLPKHLKSFCYRTATVRELWDEDGETLEPEHTSPALLLSKLVLHSSSLERLEISSIQRANGWIGGPLNRAYHDHGYAPDDGQVWAEHRNAIEDEDEWEELKEENPDIEDDLASFWRQVKNRLIQPLNLQPFTVLTVLDCHATDILGPMYRADPTQWRNLTDVLPSSIETLKLTYTDYFDDHEPQWRYDGENFKMDPDWYHSYYGHVSGLLSMKARQLPHLRHFHMNIEPDAWPSPSEDISEQAASLGIEMEIERSKWYKE